LPSLGNATTLSDYEVDLGRIEADLAEMGGAAFTAPVKSAETTLYVYRLFARSSLNGNLKELRAVEAAIDRAIECVGPAEDLCLLKANLDFKLHRLAETRRDLAMVPALAGRRQGQVLLSDLAFQEGRYEEARRALEALAADDSTWDVLARIAHIEGKLGDAERADQLYVQAEDEITSKEMRSFAWVELQRGLLDLGRGRVDDALAHYDCAKRAYSGYWLTEEQMGDALASAVHYERVLKKVNKPEVAEKLGKLYSADGKDTQAEQLFERALSDYLESAERGEVHYYHHLTEFFADVRRNGDEAVQWARKDIALRDNFNTQAALAWALHCAGQSAAGIVHMEQALRSGVKDAALYKHAALIFEGAGEHAKAHHWKHRAACLNPLGIHAHVH
jgi:tetratricopeptide (TPR) repeat protein